MSKNGDDMRWFWTGVVKFMLVCAALGWTLDHVAGWLR